MSEELKIGDVAKRAGVGVETVRFYERRGLLSPVKRKTSGYRVYDDEAVAILRFIRRAKTLGFTLREIKGLIDLRLDQSASRTEVRQHARGKIADIEAKIADLERMRNALQALVEECHGDGSLVGCPILKALEQDPI